MIFAGGGADGAANGLVILYIGGLGLLVAVLIGWMGIKLARSKKKVLRLFGVVILLMSCALPFLVCSGFQHIPSRSALRKKIEKGMTKREVLDIAGELGTKGAKDWIYYTDFWGIGFYVVIFGDDGLVDRTFID